MRCFRSLLTFFFLFLISNSVFCEYYASPVEVVLDEATLDAVRFNGEALGDGGRLFIPEVGIDAALYRVRFINLDPVLETPVQSEEQDEIPEVMELPYIKEITEYQTEPSPAEVVEPFSEATTEQIHERADHVPDQAVSPLPEDSDRADPEAAPIITEAARPEREDLPLVTEVSEPIPQETVEETTEEFWIDFGLAQIICDEWDSAVWLVGMRGCPNIIADHASQGFDGIKRAHEGTLAYLKTSEGTQIYVCVNVIQGHNTGTFLTDYNGNRLYYDHDGGLVMYTCNENWQNITIALWQRIDAWVGESGP